MSAKQRVAIGKAADFGDKKTVKVNGEDVVVARVGDGYCAVLNRCPHMNLPLAGGKIEDGMIECPFHNSRFDLCTGENKDWVQGAVGIKMPRWTRNIIAMGKQPTPVKAFTIIEEDGDLYVEL